MTLPNRTPNENTCRGTETSPQSLIQQNFDVSVSNEDNMKVFKVNSVELGDNNKRRKIEVEYPILDRINNSVTLETIMKIIMALPNEFKSTLTNELNQVQLETIRQYMHVEPSSNMQTDDEDGEKTVTIQFQQSRVKLLSAEELEIIEQVQNISDLVENVQPFLLDVSKRTLQQPLYQSMADVLFQEPFVSDNGFNNKTRMNIVLQWNNLVHKLMKYDFETNLQAKVVSQDTTTGEFILKLNIGEFTRAVGGLVASKLKKACHINDIKKMLKITADFPQDQVFVLEKMKEELNHELVGYVFQQDKILHFFELYDGIISSLEESEKTQLEDELRRAFDNKNWMARGSVCESIFQRLTGADCSNFCGSKLRHLGIFLGRVNKWWVREDLVTIVSDVCKSRGINEECEPTVVYRMLRDGFEPLIFIRFYKLLKQYTKFKELY